jgi:succinate dehydrogenase / fumarate reductase flavoprotein subunit
MQGLADGYFILPYTIGNYLAGVKTKRPSTDSAEFHEAEGSVNERIQKLLAVSGRRTVSDFHKQLGKVLWTDCGMARNRKGLQEALRQIPSIREEFWKNVIVPGENQDINQSLEKALRVADFLELAELLCTDALAREESCGCHLREEYQTAEGECQRNDQEFAYVAAWSYQGEDKPPALYKEPLVYEELPMAQRSYK